LLAVQKALLATGKVFFTANRTFFVVEKVLSPVEKVLLTVHKVSLAADKTFSGVEKIFSGGDKVFFFGRKVSFLTDQRSSTLNRKEILCLQKRLRVLLMSQMEGVPRQTLGSDRGDPPCPIVAAADGGCNQHRGFVAACDII
jgi:hypothetical protein